MKHRDGDRDAARVCLWLYHRSWSLPDIGKSVGQRTSPVLPLGILNDAYFWDNCLLNLVRSLVACFGQGLAIAHMHCCISGVISSS